MSATDELRRMLDERGVEHEGGERSLRWRDRYGIMMQAFPLANGELGMGVWSCTPEQAVEATLGRGTCHDTDDSGTDFCCSATVYQGYIELPKDADGVPIHVGDVLTDGEYTFTVFELAAFGGGSWSIRNEDGNAWAACDVTHHHEPTVEDVLRAFWSDVDLERADGCGDFSPIIAEYAAKLRLADDGGEQ